MVRAGALRKRYILFEYAGESMDEETLKRRLYAEALRFFGELGLSCAAIKLVGFDRIKAIGIIRCERDYLEKTLGFLALLGELDSKPARIRAIRSSGTIKSLG